MILNKIGKSTKIIWNYNDLIKTKMLQKFNEYYIELYEYLIFLLN